MCAGIPVLAVAAIRSLSVPGPPSVCQLRPDRTDPHQDGLQPVSDPAYRRPPPVKVSSATNV